MTPAPVLIGSCALKIRLADHGITLPEPRDADYLALPDNLPSHDSKPVDIIDGTGIIDTYCFDSDTATIDELYTLKVSHSPWVIGNTWYKHIRHIRGLRDIGAELIPELHDAAYAQWEKRKGAKKVNLNQDKEEFFTSGVRRTYEHDSVHTALAIGDHPGFLDILADGEEVKVSREKFDALPVSRRVELVQEEVMVLSSERDLIPMSNNREITMNEIIPSYQRQLQLLITRYSKGWFPRFIIEHYFECAEIPGNYWERLVSSEKLVRL